MEETRSNTVSEDEDDEMGTITEPGTDGDDPRRQEESGEERAMARGLYVVA